MLSNPSIESEGEIGVNRRWLEFAPVASIFGQVKRFRDGIIYLYPIRLRKKTFFFFFFIWKDEEEERDEINGFSSRE